jgi:segregation and condensation protein B
MALIAYRQPITRGEIEEVRGVSVSSNIVKTLLERDWIKVLGHKDVPGKPTLYGTTKEFLDYFNLKSLDQLPTLAEIKDLDSIHPELALDDHEQVVAGDGQTDEKNSEQLPVQNDGVLDNKETDNNEADEGELESMATEVAEDISDAVSEDEELADPSDDMLDSEKQVFNV